MTWGGEKKKIISKVGREKRSINGKKKTCTKNMGEQDPACMPGIFWVRKRRRIREKGEYTGGEPHGSVKGKN